MQADLAEPHFKKEAGDLRAELAMQDGKRLAIEGDAGRLHACQYRDERQLDLAEEAVQAVDLAQPALEGVAHGERRQGLEPGSRGRRQLAGRWQDLVEVLGDDIGDGLAAQGRVEDVRGDLRVERDRRRVETGIVGKAGDEDRFDLVADQRDAQPFKEVAERL